MSFRQPKPKKNTITTSVGRKSCVPSSQSQKVCEDRNASNSSNRSGSRTTTAGENKSDQVLSSTFNSTGEGTFCEMPCDLSEIVSDGVETQDKCSKSKVKEKKKAVIKSMTLTSSGGANFISAEYIQRLFLYTLQEELKQKKTDESEACLRNLEAEALKVENELETVAQRLRQMCELRECSTKIDSTEKTFSEVAGDLYELWHMLNTVNQEMKIASGQVPLGVLKVSDISKDKFLSMIQEFANVRNEMISIIEPHEKSREDAAQNFERLAAIVPHLKLLRKECGATLPSVLDNIIRAVSLQLCRTVRTCEL